MAGCIFMCPDDDANCAGLVDCRGFCQTSEACAACASRFPVAPDVFKVVQDCVQDQCPTKCADAGPF
ncbi:MAG TPA: hypothetical protein VGM56_18380 [Byssovorax sp.]